MNRHLFVVAALTLSAVTLPGSAQAAGPLEGTDVTACATPAASASFLVLPVNAGKAFSANTCLAQQATGTRLVQLFTNGAMPGPTATNWPGDVCTGQLTVDCATRYGTAAADNALATVSASGVQPLARIWWLDVENLNTWAGPAALNLASIKGELAEIAAHPDLVSTVGLYANKQQWGEITGGDQTITAAQWTATPTAAQSTAISNCSAETSFTSGPVVMTQYALDGATDGDHICPPRLAVHKTPTSGRSMVLTGSALPGSTVTIQTHEPNHAIHTYQAATGPAGTWGHSVKLGFSGSIVLSSDAGSVKGPISVNPVLTLRVAASRCGITATGVVTPRWPGQRVTVAVSGGHSKIVGTNSHGAWHAAIAEPCGTRVSVQARVSGATGHTRWTNAARSRSVIVRTLV